MNLPSLPPTPESEPKFVNESERLKYQCSLHNGVLRDAMQTVCGHRYCKSCIEAWLVTNNNTKCPAEEEDCVILSSTGENGSHIYPDASARREILNLKVECTFKKFGCKRIVAWKKLKACQPKIKETSLNDADNTEDITIHDHEAICDFKQTECPNMCGKSLKENDLRKHLQLECELRKITCQYCKAELPFNQLAIHHESDCPEMVMQCPYKCESEAMKRSQIQQHLETCPNKPIPCQFKSAGCTFMTHSDQELKEHEAKQVNIHMGYLQDLVFKMDLENKDLHKVVDELKRVNVQEMVPPSHNAGDKDREIQRLRQKVNDQQVQMVTMLERIVTMERKTNDVQKYSQELNGLKDTVKRYERRLESGEGRPSFAGGSGAISEQVAKHEQQLALQDVRLAEMDLRFQIVETASHDGILMWKIREYARRKQEAVAGKTISLYSQPFYSDRYGYKMCARVYLNGDGMGKGTHVSLFFVVMRGDYDALNSWPFSKKVILMLLDQDTGREHLSDSFRPDPTSSSFKRPTSEMNIASGCPVFVSHVTLEQRKYLNDDTIFIKFIVSD